MTDSELKKLKDNLWHSADMLRASAHLAANKYGQPILGIFLIYFLLVLLEKNVCITQEDKPQDGLSVFVGCKVCAGTQHIGRVPEVIF